MKLFIIKKSRTIIISLAAIALIISLIVYQISVIAIRETKYSHGMQQLEMARSAAVGIEYYLHHLSQDMRLLASFPGLQYFEMEPLQSNIDYFYANSRNEGLKTILLIDTNQHLVYSKGDSLPGWAAQLITEKINHFYHSNSRQSDIWLSRVNCSTINCAKGDLRLLILVPMFQTFRDKIHPDPSQEFVGVVAYLIDFNWIVQQFIEPVRIGNSGFAWVLDGQGRLLYHPRHPEMILRSIYQAEESCLRCHTSFEKQAALISDNVKYQEYQVSNEPAKLLAQAPVNIYNEKWIVAVSIDGNEVTSIMRNNYQLFFWLVAVMFISVVIGGVLLIDSNNRRNQAEATIRLNEQQRQHRANIDQAARLASIGELIDTVAHEINNPLGVITNKLEALKLRQKNLQCEDSVNYVLDQCRRIGNYTRRLLRMSRRMPFNPTATELPHIVEGCLRMLNFELKKKDVSVQRQWPDKLPKIDVDSGQIEQVLLNIIKNGVDAVNVGGKIGITIFETPSEQGTSGILIEISDNGSGIEKDHIDQIFKPFFSTKSQDKGTGLGLHISKSIVERHSGTIKVESVMGKGSCFKIFLPQSQSISKEYNG